MSENVNGTAFLISTDLFQSFLKLLRNVIANIMDDQVVNVIDLAVMPPSLAAGTNPIATECGS